MNCDACGKSAKHLCCEGHAYCNQECQKEKWELHQHRCLNGSPTLSEGKEGEKKIFRFNGSVVAERANLRILMDNEESRINDPVILKLLEPYGVKHYPRLEVLYGFKKNYEFLKRFDFKLKLVSLLDDDISLRWVFEEATINSTKRELNLLLQFIQGKNVGVLDYLLFKLIKSLSEGDLTDITSRKYGVLEYQDEFMVLTRFMLGRNMDQLLTFCKNSVFKFEIVSIQDYLMEKMEKLHTVKDDSPPPLHSVKITLPDFDNIFTPLIIKNYQEKNTSTYYINHLLEKRFITIVAQKGEYEILGYVTCTLHPIHKFKKYFISSFSDHGLSFYGSDSFEPKLFSVFSIDGLHVTDKARGGRENSIAVLLIFHVLYFIRDCVLVSKELGDILITCDSYARTTMLIMKQFGFSFIHAKRALKWLNDDSKKTGLMKEVRYYLETFRYKDERLELLLKEIENDHSNDKASEIIKKLNDYHSKFPCGGDYYNSKKYFPYEKWNSFMALTTKSHEENYDAPKRNEIFEKEMARITNLIQNNPTTNAVKRSDPQEERSEERNKRTKFSASFSESFLNFL